MLHAVCVVGYADADAAGVVKTSWGKDWGEQGFVSIAYGECGLDSEFPYFSPDVVVVRRGRAPG